jgi:hypothetical protein
MRHTLPHVSPETSVSQGGSIFPQALLWLLVALLLGACQQDVPPPPKARKLRVLLAERLPALQPDRLSEGQRRFPEAAVYLDGKPIGVIKHSELSPSLKVHKKRLENGRDASRYRIVEYLESLGVKVDRVREAHLLGGRGRAVIIAGNELRKHRETLLFSFSRGEAGKPRMHWPAVRMEINTTIDMVSAVMLYVDKAPPTYDRRELEFTFADGKPIEGIPYAAPEEALKGTRVSVDGILVGAMKRKALPNSMLMPGADLAKPSFSLAAWLASFGVDPGAVRAMELLSGEDVITRLTQKEWGDEKNTLSFTLPRRSQGKILIHLPPGDPAVKASPSDDPSLKVSAVIIYKNVTSPDRRLRPLAELLADEKAGSKTPQGDGDQDGENGGNGQGKGSARGMHQDPDE